MSETEKAAAGQGRKNISAEKRIRRFRMIDDLFFGAVMDNDILLAQKILSLILGRKIEVVSAVAERTEIDLVGRSIRTDLKVIDKRGNRYNLEVQKRRSGMNPKRLSYSLAKISDGIMEKGCNDWNKMRHRCVIMFCESDYFGNGKAVTYGETVFDGRSEDVGTEMIYVNCAYRGDDDIGRLIHDMMCSNPENIYDREIREKVRKTKEGKEIRRMCEVLDIAVRKAVGRERQIIAQKNKALAEKDNMLRNNERILEEKDNMLRNSERVLAEKDHALRNSERILAEKDHALRNSERILEEKDNTLRDREHEIDLLKRENEMLKKRIAAVSSGN